MRDADDIPIDEGFIDVLIDSNPNKAKDWIARAKDAGSTHYDLALSGDYNENLGWTNRYPIPGSDWTNNVSGFAKVIDFIITNGFIPHIHLACDGQSNPNGGYNDPVGWTYGVQWGLTNLPRIMNELQKYWKYCLWCSGYDGCFPNWTRDQMIAWMKMMKGISSDINISTEFAGPGSISYSHMGNGSLDWQPDALGMLDAFLIEVMTYPPNLDGLQQTAARLLGPAKRNIGNGANGTTNDGPDYLAAMRAQKEIGICLYESNAYQSVRKQITPDDARVVARTCANYGFTDFGNGLPT